ncbi:MAG: LexA family protein [Candidatus Ornithospirochaeta sp.]
MGLALKGYDLNWLLTGISNKTTNRNTNKETKNIEIDIPIIASKVSAGSGEEWRDDDFLEGQMVPITKDLIKGHDVKKIFAAQVKGDSMIDAMIFDGDYVFAVKDEIRGDGIYILSVDGEVLVKRLEYDAFEHKVNVISANKAYAPRTVDEDRIIILGKVIGWLHHHPF